MWADYFENLGQSRFRTSQILSWIYQKQSLAIDDWLNVSKTLRQKIGSDFSVELPKIITLQTAKDGVKKWLFELSDKNAIETVMIPEKNRRTLCISSQVGCVLNCSFCATAREGFVRNLKTSEIIAQIFLANEELKKQNLEKITNVVFMGMGEPLLNSKEVFKVVDLLRDDLAFGLSKRKITISSAGIVPEIEKIENCSFALSLHCANDETRNQIVPLNKKYPLAELKKACQNYVKKGGEKRHIFLEYVMLKDINDSLENAKQLVDFAKSFKSKVNLIPFNDFDNSGFKCSSDEQIEKFKNHLFKNGIRVMVRKQRGFDISSSCGQLKGDIFSKFKRNN